MTIKTHFTKKPNKDKEKKKKKRKGKTTPKGRAKAQILENEGATEENIYFVGRII